MMKLQRDIYFKEEKLRTINNKLGHYRPKNVKRREKRLKQQLATQSELLSTIQREKEGLIHRMQSNLKNVNKMKSKARKRSKLKSYYKRRCDKLTHEHTDNKDHVKEDKIKELNQEETHLQNKLTDDREGIRMNTMAGGVFSDDIHECVLDLVSLEVAADKVGQVIKSTFQHLTNVH